jgi:hypothetical protein
MSKNSKTIAFRLHEALMSRLEARADEQGISVGALVRQMVIRDLSNPLDSKFVDLLTAVQATVDRLEKQFRLATVSLLCNAGHAEPDEAVNWVRDHLGPVNGADGAQS